MLRVFDAREVTRFWASEKYTVFRQDGEEHLLEEPLSSLEARLAPHGFVRVHRGELVNVGSVRGVRSVEGGVEVELSDGQCARVSRRSVAELRRALGL